MAALALMKIHPRFSASGGWRRCVGIAVLWMLVQPLCPAQQPLAPASVPAPEPDALRTARAAFLQRIVSDSLTLSEQYERALGKLESDLASTGDYEEADAVRRRRDQLRTLLDGNETTLNMARSVPLPSMDTRITGTAYADEGALTGWRTATSAAEWSSFKLTPGRYYLDLSYTMTDAPVSLTTSSSALAKYKPVDSARFDFFEVSLLAGAAENRRTFDLTRTPDLSKPGKIRIGPVSFTHSPITLRLAATEGYPANQIRLFDLRLTPAGESDTNGQASGGEPAAALSAQVEIRNLKTKLDASLVAAERPLIESYLADLRQLNPMTENGRDAAQAEIARAERLLADGKPLVKSPRSVLGLSLGLGGFDDISDARWVADPANTGDHFKVEHDGEVFWVDLLWVRCAPPSDQDPSGLKQFAKYFPVSDEDALALGRVAQEFTAGYLEGKPLRLLIRTAREKDGARRALVFLDDLGLFQSMLIDQGLAALAPPSHEVKLGVLEASLLRSITDHEKLARERRPASGAWALRSAPQTPENSTGRKEHKP